MIHRTVVALCLGFVSLALLGSTADARGSRRHKDDSGNPCREGGEKRSPDPSRQRGIQDLGSAAGAIATADWLTPEAREALVTKAAKVIPSDDPGGMKLIQVLLNELGQSLPKGKRRELSAEQFRALVEEVDKRQGVSGEASALDHLSWLLTGTDGNRLVSFRIERTGRENVEAKFNLAKEGMLPLINSPLAQLGPRDGAKIRMRTGPDAEDELVKLATQVDKKWDQVKDKGLTRERVRKYFEERKKGEGELDPILARFEGFVGLARIPRESKDKDKDKPRIKEIPLEAQAAAFLPEFKSELYPNPGHAALVFKMRGRASKGRGFFGKIKSSLMNTAIRSFGAGPHPRHSLDDGPPDVAPGPGTIVPDPPGGEGESSEDDSFVSEV